MDIISIPFLCFLFSFCHAPSEIQANYPTVPITQHTSLSPSFTIVYDIHKQEQVYQQLQQLNAEITPEENNRIQIKIHQSNKQEDISQHLHNIDGILEIYLE